MRKQIMAFIERLATTIVDDKTMGRSAIDWNMDEIWDTLRSYYPPSVTFDEVCEAHGGQANLTRDTLISEIAGDMRTVYEDAEEHLAHNPIALQQLGEEPMRRLERYIVINTVDRLWREHLYEVDYLKEGIGLRAMGQRDPLVEYRDEAAKMFNLMMERVREESVQGIFVYSHQFKNVYQQYLEQQEQAQKANEAGEQSADQSAEQAAQARSSARANAMMSGLKKKSSTQQHLKYSGSADSESSTGENRAQRRAKKKGKK